MHGAFEGWFDNSAGWFVRGVIVTLGIGLLAGSAGASEEGHGERAKILQWIGYEAHTTSRLSDESVPVIDPDQVPDRPMRLELGNAFVGTGPISRGFELPTGAVWTPSLLLFGFHRSALQMFDGGRPEADFREWANRLDVHANLILSGTERVTFSMRPIDEGFFGPNPNTGRFTGYYFNRGNGLPPPINPSGHGDFKKEFNHDMINLFFEADIGELFPRLDPEDRYPLDISVTVGRQQFFYQEGILIFDFFDGVGITKNSIRLPGTSNLQVAALYGWNEINRGDNFEQSGVDLYGLFFAVDHPWTTINFDNVFVHDGNDGRDGYYTGLSFVQRIGHFSTAIRAVASVATDEQADRIGPTMQGPTSEVDTGVVIFLELGWVPPWTHNGVYATFFAGINDYTPAARMPGVGGPMGRAGLNFAGQGLGRYPASVANFAQDVFGAALGYQFILDGPAARRQLILELGGRQDTNDAGTATLAMLGRFQQAFGQRFLLQLDLFGAVGEQRSPGWGGRIEWRTNF